MPAPTPEHVAKLCVDGDVTSLPRVMRDVADQLSALDHQYRQQMTALLAMHDKVVARGGELAPAAEESAALRRLEIQVVATAQKRVQVATQAVAKCGAAREAVRSAVAGT
jgi:hypothetical protein